MAELVAKHADIIIWGLVLIAIISFVICWFTLRGGERGWRKPWFCAVVIVLAIFNAYAVNEIRNESKTTLEEWNCDYDYKEHIDHYDGITVYYKTTVFG